MRKKENKAKEMKTMDARENALKRAKKRALEEKVTIKQKNSMASLTIRKPYWFEKFYWFISSDNYIIVAGRDTQ